RHHDVHGEGAVALDTDPDRVGTEMAAAGHAVATAAADDVALGADQLSLVQVLDTLAPAGDLADELVPDHQRRLDGRLRPLVPALDVEVGPADPGPQHPDQHLAPAR